MAGKLVLSFNGETLGEFELDKESIIIGRRPTSDVHIDNLSVSGSHARVLTILNDSFLEDLDSTNGVFVNGDRVNKHALRHGDVVSIGKHELRFVFDGQEEQRDDYAETIVLSPNATPLTKTVDAEGRQVAAKPADGGLPTARLRLLTDDGPSKDLTLTKALTTLGKPGVQVAAISRRSQGDFLVHVEGGAENRVPLVNGAPIGIKSHLLRHQDVIEVAGVKMEYFRE